MKEFIQSRKEQDALTIPIITDDYLNESFQLNQADLE